MHPALKIELRDPNSLRRHPLHKAHIPPPDKGSPRWQAFADTVHADGRIITPIITTQDGLVMDGWSRREAAHDLQFEEVPCEVRDASEAPLFLVESLTARKQMTRGAAVYLALGLLPDYARACEDRRVRNVAAQRTTNEAKLGGKDVIGTDHACRYLAQRWGCGVNTIVQARLVRALLHDPKAFIEWAKSDVGLHQGPQSEARRDPEKVMAALRAEFEPLLFNGEKSLWTILQAIAGRFAGARKEPEQEQLELFTSHFAALGGHWRRLSEDARDFLAKKLPFTLAGLPEEVLDLLEESIARARAQATKNSV